MIERANSQMHGKSFENQIKSSNGIFTYAAADRSRSATQMFDIDGDLDQKYGYPTSVKTMKSNLIYLSDARRFWNSLRKVPYRILIGKYSQKDELKEFESIHEIILREYSISDLLGDISESEINNFHERLKTFGPGPSNAKQARNWAHEHKNNLHKKRGIVKLNPKIDTRNQRRLQCSVSLEDLISIIVPKDYLLHKDKFGTTPLPIKVYSGERRFSK